MFAARHYEVIAAVIRAERDKADAYGRDTLDMLVSRFAAMFGEDNPRFDRARFLRAATGRETYREPGAGELPLAGDREPAAEGNPSKLPDGWYFEEREAFGSGDRTLFVYGPYETRDAALAVAREIPWEETGDGWLTQPVWYGEPTTGE